MPRLPSFDASRLYESVGASVPRQRVALHHERLALADAVVEAGLRHRYISTDMAPVVAELIAGGTKPRKAISRARTVVAAGASQAQRQTLGGPSLRELGPG